MVVAVPAGAPAPDDGDPVLGRADADGVEVAEPATVGVTTHVGSFMVPGVTQLEAAAPAIPGTMANDPTAKLEPIIRRLANFM